MTGDQAPRQAHLDRARNRATLDGLLGLTALSWTRPCGGLQFLLKGSTMGMSAGTRNDAPAAGTGF
jgi:hypothetical protein